MHSLLTIKCSQYYKDPSLWKENKSSGGAENDAKSVEDEAPHEWENFRKQSVILCSDWCNIIRVLV